MKVLPLFSQFLCLLIAGMNVYPGNTLAGKDTTGFEAIDQYITAQMRSARIPGLSLAVVKGDQIVYLKGYGRADQTGRVVTPQTPLIIGSISKSFTALAVMQLVEAGKVELDAPVQRYIPWFRTTDPQASAQITVRMLINQTSGLPQLPTFATWTWPNTPDVLEQHVRLMANTDLLFPPGQSYTYSNANWAAQAVIVQAVSGLSFEDYIKQHIFAPLDMQHSYVSEEEALQDGMAQGYRWWFGYPIPARLPFNRANLPAGFFISSAEDMAHFMIAQMNGGSYQGVSVISPEGIAILHTEPPPGTYGMGWESVRLDGRRLINHDGATGNYQGSIFIDPEARVGVFAAANVMNGLDGLSSPRSSTSLGNASALITTRIMAYSLLNLVTGRPLPRQGPGFRRVSLITSLLILGLTGALVLSLFRISDGYGQLALHGIASAPDLAGRIAGIALLHFSLPLALLVVALKAPFWTIAVLYMPDVITWLESVSVVLFLKGWLEIGLAWRVFSQIQRVLGG